MNPIDRINEVFNQLDQAVKEKLKGKYPCMTGCDLTVAIHEERKLISKTVLELTPIELFDKAELFTAETVEKMERFIELDIKLLNENISYSARKEKLAEAVAVET